MQRFSDTLNAQKLSFADEIYDQLIHCFENVLKESHQNGLWLSLNFEGFKKMYSLLQFAGSCCEFISSYMSIVPIESDLD